MTGVQTCALPIWKASRIKEESDREKRRRRSEGVCERRGRRENWDSREWAPFPCESPPLSPAQGGRTEEEHHSVLDTRSAKREGERGGSESGREREGKEGWREVG